MVGATPISALDRAPYFEIQAGFFIAPKDSNSELRLRSDCVRDIPNMPQLVHVGFSIEQAVSGTDQNQEPTIWPTQAEYRNAFTCMLAAMLSNVETDLKT